MLEAHQVFLLLKILFRLLSLDILFSDCENLRFPISFIFFTFNSFNNFNDSLLEAKQRLNFEKILFDKLEMNFHLL